MSCFIDTSAFMAVVHSDDANHSIAVEIWRALIDHRANLITTNYVVVESISLMHQWSGISIVHKFTADLLVATDVKWIDKEVHMVGIASVLAGSRGGPSLVDWTSFEFMRRGGIQTAFAFDKHFDEQGLSRPSQVV